MARPSYRRAIEFIALNDEPMDSDVVVIAGYVTTVMLSEMTGRPCEAIARAVLRVRKREELGVRRVPTDNAEDARG